jgi:hypothetical protein
MQGQQKVEAMMAVETEQAVDVRLVVAATVAVEVGH